MKKTSMTSFVAGLVLLAGSGAALAQDDTFKVIPIELFTCNYIDQKGPADLDAVVDKWNMWADQSGVDDYAAWTLTPFYFGSEQTFDVIWIGAGKDGVALGKAQDSYNAENAGLHAAFSEVLSCDGHASYASLNFKAAPEGKTPSDSVMTFSDCKYKDGASFDMLSAAMGEWAQYQSDAGSTAPIFHWYPVYGGGGEEYSFKWLEAYENMAELGADFDRMGNGEGWIVNNRLFSELISCDSSRAYLAKNRRFVQLR